MTLTLSRAVDQLIEELRGSGQDADALLDILTDGEYPTLMDLPMPYLLQFDDAIFLRPGCNWWCDMDEANDSGGEDVCNDCYEGD